MFDFLTIFIVDVCRKWEVLYVCVCVYVYMLIRASRETQITLLRSGVLLVYVQYKGTVVYVHA